MSQHEGYGPRMARGRRPSPVTRRPGARARCRGAAALLDAGARRALLLGVDEPEVMDRAVRMVQTGDFNPHFFDYPSLYMYVQAAVVVARFLFGAMRGEWSSLAQACRPTDFYLWGRAVTAILGTATCSVLYLRRHALGRADGAARRGAARGHAAARARIPLHADRRADDVPRDADAFCCRCARTSGRRWGRSRSPAPRPDWPPPRNTTAALAMLMPLIACCDDAAARPSRLLVLAGDRRRAASARSCSPRPTRCSICRRS